MEHLCIVGWICTREFSFYLLLLLLLFLFLPQNLRRALVYARKIVITLGACACTCVYNKIL